MPEYRRKIRTAIKAWKWTRPARPRNEPEGIEIRRYLVTHGHTYLLPED